MCSSQENSEAGHQDILRIGTVAFQVQHEYNCLFESDLLRLNVFGKMRLKRALLEGAGFMQSKSEHSCLATFISYVIFHKVIS